MKRFETYVVSDRPASCGPVSAIRSVSRSSSCGLNRFPTKIKTPIFSYYRLPTVGLSLQTGSTTAASGGQRHADAHHPSRPPPTPATLVDTPAVGLRLCDSGSAARRRTSPQASPLRPWTDSGFQVQVVPSSSRCSGVRIKAQQRHQDPGPYQPYPHTR